MKIELFDKISDSGLTTYELDGVGNLQHRYYHDYNRPDYMDIRKTALKMSVVPVKKGDETQRCFILQNKQKQSTPLLVKMHMHDGPIRESLTQVLCSIANARAEDPSHVYVDLSTGAISEPFHYVKGMMVDQSGSIVTLNPDLTFADTGLDYEQSLRFDRIDSKGVVTNEREDYIAAAKDSLGRYCIICNYGSRSTEPKVVSDYSFDSPNITKRYLPRQVENPRPYTIYQYDNLVEYRTETTKVLQETYTNTVIQAVPAGKEYNLQGCANFEEYYTSCLVPYLNEKKLEHEESERMKRQARMEARTTTAEERVSATPLKGDKVDKLSKQLISKKPIRKPRRPIKEVLAEVGEVTLDVLSIIPEMFSEIGSCDRSSEYTEGEKIGAAVIASQIFDSPIAGIYAYNQMESKNEEIRAEKARKEKESKSRSMGDDDY